MSLSPVLYMIHPSPPSRAVMMTAKAIGLDLELREIDFFNKEHLQPDFLKINPQHTIPTLVDTDGFIVWDSHAIMIYLVSKYAKNDCLYPFDLKKRAVIDQRLHFESGIIFAVLRRTFRPIVLCNQNFIDEKNISAITEAYEFLNTFLENNDWIAGDSVTIADFSILSSIGTLSGIVPLHKEKWPRLINWLQKCKQLPEYEVNKKGENEMINMILKKIK